MEREESVPLRFHQCKFHNLFEQVMKFATDCPKSLWDFFGNPRVEEELLFPPFLEGCADQSELIHFKRDTKTDYFYIKSLKLSKKYPAKTVVREKKVENLGNFVAIIWKKCIAHAV